MPSDSSRFEKLSNENYHEWKIYMEALLVKRGLYDIISGSVSPPSGSPNSKAVISFRRKQSEARSELILNVSSAQLSHCRNTDPAIIWTDLARVHSSTGRSTIISLRRRFNCIRLGHSETIPSYVARIQHLAFLLQESNYAIIDDDIILAITSGLPKSYDPFLISLDATPDHEYTLPTVITRLVNEYQRQHMYANPTTSASTRSPTTIEDEAMAVVSPTGTPLAHITCFTCGRKGHYQANCSTNRQPQRINNAAPPAEANAVHSDDEDSEGVFLVDED